MYGVIIIAFMYDVIIQIDYHFTIFACLHILWKTAFITHVVGTDSNYLSSFDLFTGTYTLFNIFIGV